MNRDHFQQLGRALRTFLEIFQKSHRTREHFDEMRKQKEQISRLAEQLKEPHLGREVKQFLEKLDRFFSHPGDELLGQEIAKCALHLEQETREI